MPDFSRHHPDVHESAFVADGARVLGAVTLKEGASVWYNAVLRADLAAIVVGEESNIQDNCVVHVESGRGTTIGRNVTVGHNVVLHACTIEDNCLIGMGAVILDGAHIGRNSLVGAGSVVPPGKTYAEGLLILGMPAKVVRKLGADEVQKNIESSRRYRAYAEAYVKKGIQVYKNKIGNGSRDAA